MEALLIVVVLTILLVFLPPVLFTVIWELWELSAKDTK